MKLSALIWFFFSLHTVPVWAQTIEECNAILLNQDTDTGEEGCELDFVAQLECIQGEGMGRLPPAGNTDLCENIKYQTCPRIILCYKGCAKQAVQEEYSSCVATVSVQATGQSGECILDCANFDFGDGSSINNSGGDGGDGDGGGGDDSGGNGSGGNGGGGIDVDEACRTEIDQLDSTCATLFNEGGEAEFTQCLLNANTVLQGMPQSQAPQDFCKQTQVTYCLPTDCYPEQCRASILDYYQCIVDELVKVYSEAEIRQYIGDDCKLNVSCEGFDPSTVDASDDRGNGSQGPSRGHIKADTDLARLLSIVLGFLALFA